MDFQNWISRQSFNQEAQLVVISDSYSLNCNSGFERRGMVLAPGVGQGGVTIIYKKGSGMVIKDSGLTQGALKKILIRQTFSYGSVPSGFLPPNSVSLASLHFKIKLRKIKMTLHCHGLLSLDLCRIASIPRG